MKRTILFISLMSLGWLVTACLEKNEPTAVPTHPDNWVSKSSENFHGAVLLNGGLNIESCQSCHGQDYQGGTSNVSCFSSGCHNLFPHPEGFANPGSGNFHDEFIAMLKWDITACQSCHGNDYMGEGVDNKDCTVCHNAEKGPEACNTCHGDMANAAPPKDLMDRTDTRFKTVGAHQPHLVGDTWSTFSQGDCKTCHITPAELTSAGHLDDSEGAEVIFNDLADFDGKSNAHYDVLSGSCSDTYCHGGFEFKKSESAYPWAYTDSVMAGNNAKVEWQFVGLDQARCGSCHGLPPKGHIASELDNCAGCHGRVVDSELNIVNKFLHINGKIEVFN